MAGNDEVREEAEQERMIRLPDGGWMPRLGQGTWKMGEDDRQRAGEVKGLRRGIAMGISMIDTAEMYADGRAESIAGDAIEGTDRNKLVLVSKVYPENANVHRIYSSLVRTLRLMQTDYLDMYLLHWRGEADLAEVVWCMEDLKDKGLIRRWGVSNFDVQDMEDLMRVPDGAGCCVNQVLYNLGSRGIEYDLMPWQRARGIPFMAYCPVGQAGGLVTQDGVSKAALMQDENVRRAAEKLGLSVVQLLLAFVMRHPDMAAIPKAVQPVHIEENCAAASVKLPEEILEVLDRSFPAPASKIPMEKY